MGKKFLSPTTYLHLRVGIVGFFEYAKMVLNDVNGPRYVPFLHSNSSSIEAWFSMVRGAKRDTPVAYRGAVGAMDVSKAKNGSGMYEDGEVEDMESGDNKFEQTFHRRDKQRDKWLLNLQKQRLSNFHPRNFELPAFAQRQLRCANPAGFGNEILTTVHAL